MKNTRINEDNFFSKVAPYLFKSEDLIAEIIENAVRAKASMIDIKCDEKNLEIYNNGLVLKDFSKLFNIADSGYDHKTIEMHKPAGMGFLSLLASCSRITIVSGINSITIDCDLYFNDSNYRLNLEDLIKIVSNDNSVNGLKINAILNKNIRLPKYYQDEYKFYPIDIVVNNKKIPSNETLTALVKKEYSTGVNIYLNSVSNYGCTNNGLLIWHGKKIKVAALTPFTIEVNGKTNLLTPQLPDRRNVVETVDEIRSLKKKLESFMKDDIQNFLNDLESDENVSNLIKVLNGSYNLDHLNEYQGLKKSDNKRVFAKEKFTEATVFENGKEIIDANFFEILKDGTPKEVLNTFVVVPSMIGLTSAPTWVLENLETKLEIKINTSSKSKKASRYGESRDCFIIADSITINDLPITLIKDGDMDYYYFTKEINSIDFAEEYSSTLAYEYQDTREAEYEIERS